MQEENVRVSSFSGALFFLCLAVLAPAVPNILCDTEIELSEWRELRYLFCLIGLVMLCYAIFFCRYIVLTEEGIERKFFGWRYRMTPWGNIQDVVRGYGAKGSKMLVVTTMQGTVCRPDGFGFINQKITLSGLSDLWHGNYFVIPYDSAKTEKKIISYIQKHYGPLDYDGCAR